MITEPIVKFEVKEAAGHLTISYSTINQANAPIFVFDRLWNLETNALNPDWAYVEIANRVAIFKREMALLPRGLHFENPPVPYAREVAVGAKAVGVFKVTLPLAETGPYDHITKRGQRRNTDIDKLELEIGWCLKPAASALPAGIAPVKINGEQLWLLPYDVIAAAQKISRSPSQAIQVQGSFIR